MNNTILMIGLTIAVVTAIGAVALAIANTVRVNQLRTVSDRAQRLAAVKTDEVNARLYSETILSLLLGQIIVDLYTSDDVNVIRWKLFHLRELDDYLNHRLSTDSTYFRDHLLDVLTKGPQADRIESLNVIRDKMASYYTMDIEVRNNWMKYLDILERSVIDYDNDHSRDLLLAGEALRMALRDAHIGGVILDTEPIGPEDPTPQEMFQQMVDGRSRESEPDLSETVKSIIGEYPEEEAPAEPAEADDTPAPDTEAVPVSSEATLTVTPSAPESNQARIIML